MFIDLDSPDCRDPVKVGTKAATLSTARSSGVPVLPGWVVPGSASRPHMELGKRVLSERGSGAARLAMLAEQPDFAEALVAAGTKLDDRLVARSSALVETSGEWSGAFASYVDISPAELPKAVVGCWASAFTVAALERQGRSGVEPGSFAMPVLVQPALQAEAGGWARLASDGEVTVHGVKGSPAPLLQGWESGATGLYRGKWSGDEMIELIGETTLEALRDLLESLAGGTGFNQCEWALSDGIWALQVGRTDEPTRDRAAALDPDLAEELTDTVRALVLAPGHLGEEMVLPWAIAGLPDVDLTAVAPDVDARELVRELTQEVWRRPWSEAIRSFEKVKAKLLALDPSVLVDLRRLESPDPAKASGLLAALRSMRIEAAGGGGLAGEREGWHVHMTALEEGSRGGQVEAPHRVGMGRWEQFIAAVILAAERGHEGTPASPGVGAGPRAEMVDRWPDPSQRRSVLTANRPVPDIASLLWDASGLVTATGSPAAHLFEAARALRVPAVSGVDLGSARREIVAVDGYRGTVATLDLAMEI